MLGEYLGEGYLQVFGEYLGEGYLQVLGEYLGEGYLQVLGAGGCLLHQILESCSKRCYGRCIKIIIKIMMFLINFFFFNTVWRVHQDNDVSDISLCERTCDGH